MQGQAKTICLQFEQRPPDGVHGDSIGVSVHGDQQAPQQ